MKTSAESTTAPGPLLSVSGLTVVFEGERQDTVALNSVDFEVNKGETVAIVGESGSGKSTVARSLLRLHPRNAKVTGRITFDGIDVLAAGPRSLRKIRGGGMSMVFQDPTAALNPLMTVGDQISETLRAHGSPSRAAARARTVQLLDLVGIPDSTKKARSYPQELSGGMSQRAMIAMAISARPKILIADEPTTALDVTVQAQIMALLDSLKAELGMSTVLVSHDLGVVAETADRVFVMYAGQVVEEGAARGVLRSAAHPYTRGLIDSIVPMDTVARSRLRAIPGSATTPRSKPTRCPFMPRCRFAVERCAQEDPPLLQVGGHSVACWVAHEEYAEPARSAP